MKTFLSVLVCLVFCVTANNVYAQGACCIDAACELARGETQCTGWGGVYKDQTRCNPNPCIGACCKNGGCFEGGTEDRCTDAGGLYIGNATTCDPNTCTGACCLPDDTCVANENTTKEACEVRGNGEYQGDGTTCEPDPCAEPPVTEAPWSEASVVGEKADTASRLTNYLLLLIVPIGALLFWKRLRK